MYQPSSEVRAEASRLLSIGSAQARRALGDRIARTFQLNAPATIAAFAEHLDFNARLCTELREQANRRGVLSPWVE